MMGAGRTHLQSTLVVMTGNPRSDSHASLPARPSDRYSGGLGALMSAAAGASATAEQYPFTLALLCCFDNKGFVHSCMRLEPTRWTSVSVESLSKFLLGIVFHCVHEGMRMRYEWEGAVVDISNGRQAAAVALYTGKLVTTTVVVCYACLHNAKIAEPFVATPIGSCSASLVAPYLSCTCLLACKMRLLLMGMVELQ